MSPWMVGPVFAFVLVSSTAWAQQGSARPDRPYLGLFGGGLGQAAESLIVNASVGGGYDDNVLAPNGGTAAAPGQVAGSFGQLDAGVDYSLRRTRVGLTASLATSNRYVPRRSSRISSDLGHVGATFQLWERTRFTTNQTVTYQPFYTLTLFPEAIDSVASIEPPRHDLAVGFEDYFTSSTDADISHDFSERSSGGLSYGYVKTAFGSGSRDFSSQRAGAHLSRGLTSRLRLNFTYRHEQGRYDDGSNKRQVYQESLDGGIDYTRRLTAFSRTTLSAATGSTAISERGHTYYRVVGSALLSREVGRTWTVALGYNRSSRFLETFGAPLFEDAGSLTVGGLINRRMQLQATGGASKGALGITDTNDMTTYYDTIALTVGLTRLFGFRIDYSSFTYSFDTATFLPPGVTRNQQRQTVAASLTFWVPVKYRETQGNAPR